MTHDMDTPSIAGLPAVPAGAVHRDGGRRRGGREFEAELGHGRTGTSPPPAVSRKPQQQDSRPHDAREDEPRGPSVDVIV
jgi:hypothetical protein